MIVPSPYPRVIISFLVLYAVVESISATDYCSIDEMHILCKFKLDEYGSDCNNSVEKSIKITDDDKVTIVNTHNEFRRKLAKGLEDRGSPGPQPTASNMRELVWNDELANMAQAWMNQCKDEHASSFGFIRTIPNWFLGENVASTSWTFNEYPMSDKSINYAGMIGDWYGEVQYWPDSKEKAGHYREVAWAKSTRIGCGVVMPYTLNADGEGPHTGKTFFYCFYASDISGGDLYEIGEAGTNCPEGYSAVDGLCHNDSL